MPSVFHDREDEMKVATFIPPNSLFKILKGLLCVQVLWCIIKRRGILDHLGWNFLFVFLVMDGIRFGNNAFFFFDKLRSEKAQLFSPVWLWSFRSLSVRFSSGPGGLLNLPWLLIHQSCLTNSQLARPKPPKEPLSGWSSVLVRGFCNDWDLVLLIVI